MVVKVLVVDDSSFFRRRVSEIINQDPTLEVIDTAQNGREAVEKTLRLQPDVITMDIEMPVMDGISAVREIMAKCPTPTLMFSSLTHDGAKATLVALDAGAEDVVTDEDGAIEVLTAPGAFEAVKNALEAAGLKPEVAEVTMRAENTIELQGDDAERMQKLLDVLEELDDVQDVYHNAEISE